MQFIGFKQCSIVHLTIVCVLTSGVALTANPALAIAVGQVDEFSEGDIMGWVGAAAGVLEDVGPAGDGDFALLVQTNGFPSGPNSRLTTFNGGGAAPVETQWTGDWAAAGVRKLSFDVLNPNQFELNVWLGIAGPGPPGFAGSGDAYVSKLSAAVPASDDWQAVEFSVLPDDFDAWGVGTDPAEALASIFQFRIMHAPIREWRGATGEAVMLLDNVRAIGVPEPISITLAAGAIIAALDVRRSRGPFQRSPA